MPDGPSPTGPLKILVLVAGTNEPSNSATLAAAFVKGMEEAGNVTVETIRLKDLTLEHFSLKHYAPGAAEEPDFQRVKAAILAAQGVVIATPIWNFSIPAHLKNLLDRIGSFGLDAETRAKGTLAGKPFYFIFTGGAPLPAWKGLMRFTTIHLQEAIRYFAGTIVGTLFEGKCMAGRGVFGLVVDKRPESLAKAAKRGEKFIRFVRNFVQTGTLPLYYRIFNKCYWLGQRIMAKF